MVVGLQSLKRKMTVSIPAKVRDATRMAMAKGATEIVALMKNRVPVDKGDLSDSIGWTWGDAPAGAIVIAQSAQASGERITIYAGNKAAYYARWVEFGTQKTSPQPYFYGSYRQLRKRTKSRITREMKKAIKAGAA
jgi:HK97 gp10 family phage protein